MRVVIATAVEELVLLGSQIHRNKKVRLSL